MAAGDKMRLVGARVTNFGCFRDSGEVPIDDVTVLLAENENGKTTFLRALAWWSDASEFDEDDRWNGADALATLDLVALTFEVNDAAAGALRVAGAKDPKRIRLVANTASECRVEDPESGDPVEPSRGPTRFDGAKTALISNLEGRGDDGTVALALAGELGNAKPGSGIAASTISKIRDSLIPHLAADEQTTLEGLVVAMEQALSDPGEELEPESAIDVIRPFIPKLIYFDERVDFVQDAIKYEEVSADPGAHRTMINLASLAGIDLVRISGETPHKRLQLSQQAQKTLSTDFSKYWQGDPVTIYAQVDESQMTLTIEHKGRTQRPSRRSSGMKWQLGFFVNFTAETKGDLSSAVLLLDEPGLHLHIKQQPKLLELFDDLASDGCQIIYATHLSHMLPAEKPHTFRPLIVDPKTDGAAIVVANITAMPSKSDVMQPVRQALGMGIADAIGLGGTNVIAEGWAERYVLLAMSEFCRNAEQTALSVSTTILPAGGSGKKMLPLAAMAVAEKTKAVVLVDDDGAGRGTVALLEKTLPGAVPSVCTHEEDAVTGRELEDLFAPGFYIELVNDAHADVIGYTPIESGDVDTAKPICNAIEDTFKTKGLGKFQKLRPAMELQKRLEAGEAPDEISLAQFADLFDRLTKALKKS